MKQQPSSCNVAIGGADAQADPLSPLPPGSPSLIAVAFEDQGVSAPAGRAGSGCRSARSAMPGLARPRPARQPGTLSARLRRAPALDVRHRVPALARHQREPAPAPVKRRTAPAHRRKQQGQGSRQRAKPPPFQCAGSARPVRQRRAGSAITQQALAPCLPGSSTPLIADTCAQTTRRAASSEAEVIEEAADVASVISQ